MDKIKRIDEFAAYANNYNYVSFDLFDTLIRRQFLTVHQIHDLVSAYALALLGRHGSMPVSDMTSLRYRMGGALKASPELFIQEPSAEQVWDRLLSHDQGVKDADRRRELVEQIVRFEHELEMTNLGLVDGARELLEKLRASGKTLIAISDMYFSHAYMQKILERLGIYDLFDHVYISAEVNLTKQTSDLFRHVLKDLALAPHEQIHVGDNLTSDVEMANLVGIEAVLVVQHELLKLDPRSYGKRELVAEDVADLVKAHLFTVLFDVLNRRATQIYFMARDGIALRNFLGAWKSPLRDAFLPTPEHRELYLNRALTCWANVDFSTDWLSTAIGWAFWLKEGKATRHEIAQLLGAPPVLEEVGSEVLEAAVFQFKLADAYREAGYEDLIKQQIIAKRQAIEAYLKGVGFYDHAAVAISDVGYSGTVARALNTILVQRCAEGSELLPPTAMLHLIATNQNYSHNKIHAQPHCLYSAQAVIPAHAMPSTLTGSYAWLEYFFKHPTLMPITQFRDEDGKVVPYLRMRDKPLPTAGNNELLDFAIDKPSDLILMWMAATDSYGELCGPIIERFAEPDRTTLDQMRGEVYELDPIEGTTRLVYLEMPSARPDTIEALARSRDYWIAGSLAASRFAEADGRELDGDSVKNDGVPSRQSRSKWWKKLLGSRLTSFIQSPNGFEADFYRSFYPDVAELGDEDALVAHFVRHGRKENRFGSRAAFVGQLEVEFGQLPSDFDAEAYLHFNPDVAVAYSTPEKALDHFMRHGRHEGRNYRAPVQEIDRELNRLLRDGKISLSDDESKQLGGETTLLELYLARFGLKPGAWLEKIDVVEFAALNGHWAGSVTTRAEALVVLCEHGLIRMPSLSLADPFDANYVRTTYPDLSKLTDYQLYCTCLQRMQPTSEAAALMKVWRAPFYPESFQWLAWQATHAKILAKAGRVEVLQHFLAQKGMDRIGYISGEDAPRLLEFLGHQARWRDGSVDNASFYFEEAIKRKGSVGWFEHLLGELHLAAGQPDRAITHFCKGAASDTPNRWSVLHAAELLLQQEAYSPAREVLEQGRALWQDLAPWRQLWRRAIGHEVSSIMRKFSANPQRTERLEKLDIVMSRLRREFAAQTIAKAKSGSVLVITGRTMALHERSTAPGDITVKGLWCIEAREVTAELILHETLVLHEVPCTADVLEAIAIARSMGRRVVSWLGDLSVWEDKDLAHLVCNPQGSEAGWLRRSHVWETCLVARYCDQIVSSMAGLVPAISHCAGEVPLTISGRSYQRTKDDASARAIMVLIAPEFDARSLRPVVKSTNRLAELEPNFVFAVDQRVAGHSDLTVDERRLMVFEPDTDLQTLADSVGSWDVIIQIASNQTVEPYCATEETLQHGALGLMLTLPMTEHQTTNRRNDGTVAQLVGCEVFDADLLVERVMHFNATPSAGSDSEVQSARLTHPIAVQGQRKPRLLFVNVWYPPQTIGGATKVLADNVEYILNHHQDTFDLQVFATDEHNDRFGEMSLGQHDGVPVFRFAAPQENNIYWRPNLALANASFSRLVDSFQPDLVHFHCLQKLGAGLLEVCQARQIPHFVTLHDGWWLSDNPFMTDPEGRFFPAVRDIMALHRNPTIDTIASLNRAAKVRNVLSKATRRLAVSEGFAEVYRACGIDCDVIENGASRLASEPREASGTTVNLLHLGGLERHKGLYLVEAALKRAQFSNLHLTVIDLARDAAYSSKALWGATEVTTLGRQPSAALAKLYSRSHVLLAPSTCEESFGLVTREALQQGLWVVAGNRGAMAAPVQEGINGFVVDVVDASALSRVLAEIDSNCSRFQTSPSVGQTLRTVDDQSRELVQLYLEELGQKC